MSKTRQRFEKFAAYPRLNPLGVGKNISAADLIDQTFLAYNGGRLREAAQLLTEKMLPNDGYIGMSLTGALTPAGLGKSCLIPLMKAGFVDWIVSTGANLYHDLHYGLDMQLYAGSPFLDDVELAPRRRHPHLRRAVRLQRAARYRCVRARGHSRAGIPARDGHGRVSLSPRQIR